MAGPLLFAYGTLRDARQRARVLRGALSRDVGSGSAPGALYDLGDYPGMVAGAPDDRVPGTVIELADDAALVAGRIRGPRLGIVRARAHDGAAR
jgi:gamma-glutamylcyclotransferase (GGCT)/AIG2-like uncharacterized protein YtfP